MLVTVYIVETLRKYPPLSTLTRCITKPYKVPGTEIVLPEGTLIVVPVYAIHHDPDNYPHPERFDPERFSSDCVKERHLGSYLPFGEGPRNCIGLRFGMIQARVGLAMLLKNFQFELGCTMTPDEPLEISTKSFILTTTHGMWLKCKIIACV